MQSEKSRNIYVKMFVCVIKIISEYDICIKFVLKAAVIWYNNI